MSLRLYLDKRLKEKALSAAKGREEVWSVDVTTVEICGRVVGGMGLDAE